MLSLEWTQRKERVMEKGAKYREGGIWPRGCSYVHGER